MGAHTKAKGTNGHRAGHACIGKTESKCEFVVCLVHDMIEMADCIGADPNVRS